ncbi:SRPBCC family protein [Catenulispora yoronensis]|uniref:SRPBCC family protein n=1 Tax=Catenulispora yoronensis TaxID=450799 RepID=A0ABN2UJC1_9ACTN
MRVHRTITVPRPLPVVVAYLADFGNAVHWDPGTISCVRTDSGPIRVGAAWRNVSEFNDRVTQLDYRLERMEPERLTFVGRNNQATATDDLTFAQYGGATTVTYRAEIVFHGWLRLVGPFVQRRFEKMANEVQTSLARELTAL